MYSIEISKLTKTYQNGHQALKDINLNIKKGQFLALLGKNGAGKTTFVEILSSLTKKSSGKVLINGKNLDFDIEHIKFEVGIVPQEFNISIFEKVIDILITQAGYFGIKSNIAEKRAKKLLNYFGIETGIESYFIGNEINKIEDIKSHLGNNLNLALISDAGTPLISDPGNKLVEIIIKEGFRVESTY